LGSKVLVEAKILSNSASKLEMGGKASFFLRAAKYGVACKCNETAAIYRNYDRRLKFSLGSEASRITDKIHSEIEF